MSGNRKTLHVDPEHVPYGNFHFAGAGEASWFEFATAIIGLAEKRLPKPPKLLPIPTRDYPTPATLLSIQG